jgi:hypothetical protein
MNCSSICLLSSEFFKVSFDFGEDEVGVSFEFFELDFNSSDSFGKVDMVGSVGSQ